jgi:hypothetical protein
MENTHRNVMEASAAAVVAKPIPQATTTHKHSLLPLRQTPVRPPKPSAQTHKISTKKMNLSGLTKTTNQQEI